MNDHHTVDRRQFLGGTLATAAAVVAGPGLLAACSTSSTSDTAAATENVTLPTFQPYTGVQPDLKGNEQGLLDAFLNYPDPPVRAINGTPGPGGTVTAFTQTASPVPPALGQNEYWQELNRRLGTDLKLTITPAADMPTKFATLVAGDDLPDIIVPALFTPNGLPAGLANLPKWLEAKCQDLSEFLSGDAVAEYPFLANLPTAAWRETRFNGGIYGLPVHRGVGGTLLFRRDDILDRLGVDPNPASFAEFRALCEEVTDERASRWALVSGGTAQNFINQMLGVPNEWREEGGKLTSAYEVPEFTQALSDAARMVKDGLVHPDSFTNNAPVKKWFNAGNAVLIADRYTAWPQFFADNIAGPDFDISGMRPPRYDGGGFAATYQARPTNNFTALKKAGRDRIRQLLTLANWLAAPFGTEEYLFRRYGTEGVHYTRTASGPALTQKGATQTALGIRYLVDAPDTLFVPGRPESTRKLYDYQASIIPTAVPNPVVGLFSDTWARVQGQLGTIINDAQFDILSGRSPVSSWDDTVRTWKATGGDKVRGEFQDALQRGGGD